MPQSGSNARPSTLASESAVDPKHNWLVNGGFEDADASEWDNAMLVSPGRASARALFLENKTPGWTSASQRIHFGPGKPPQEIIVSGWIRTEGVVAGKESWMMARTVVDFTGADGKQVGGWQRGAVGVGGTTPWTHFEHAYTVPAGATSVKVEASLPNIVGKVWFDDVAVVLAEADGTRRGDSRSRVERTDTSDWYTYVAPKSSDGASLDFHGSELT